MSNTLNNKTNQANPATTTRRTRLPLAEKPLFSRYSDSILPSIGPIPEIHHPVLIDPTPSPDPVKSQAQALAVLPTFQSLEISDWKSDWTTLDWITTDWTTSDHYSVNIHEPIVTETETDPEDLALEPNADANFAHFKKNGPLPKKLTRSRSTRVAKSSLNGTLVRSRVVSRKAQQINPAQALNLARAHVQGFPAGGIQVMQEERKQELEELPVRLQQCFHCPAWFLEAQDLVDHMRATHT
jgi:hypothetical protein